MAITLTRQNFICINVRRSSYRVRQGSYQGTTDDRLGRWYVDDVADPFFRPWGAGHRSRIDAARTIIDS